MISSQTTLLSLPSDLLGHICSFLPRGAGPVSDRRAFFFCCSAVHNASSVRKQFSALRITARQLQSISSSSTNISAISNPFLCFPGTQLKKLVLLKSWRFGADGVGKRWQEVESEDEGDSEGEAEEVESEASISPEEGDEAEGNEEVPLPNGLCMSRLVREREAMRRQAAASAHAATCRAQQIDSLLAEFLQPASPDARMKVMSVLRNLEEVNFVGFPMLKAESATIGTVLSLSTQLRTIKMCSHKDSFAPLLMAFAAPGGGRGLRELHFATKPDFKTQDVYEAETIEAIAAIGKLPSLHSLSLSIPLEEQSKVDEIFPPLSSLTALTSLTISDNGRCGDQLVDFSCVLKHMQCLQFLSLQAIAGPQVAVLPGTIEILVDTGRHCLNDRDISGVDFIGETLTDVASNAHRFPKLHTFDIRNMVFGGGPWNRHWHSQFSQALAALSHVRLRVEKICAVCDFAALLKFLSHVRVLAVSVGTVEFWDFGTGSATEALGYEDEDTSEDGDRPADWADSSWADQFAMLGDLCPALTRLHVRFATLTDLDIESILEARQLSSLQELEMVSTMSLSCPGQDLGSSNARKLLALAKAMSSEHGPCLSIVLRFGACPSEGQGVKAEVDQLKEMWNSMSESSTSLNWKHRDVHLQVHIRVILLTVDNAFRFAYACF
ncbi:hypothetical protein DUNSADRAFT_4954 [Dunaliella salina]|uniref:F-box domain-containing protein n=1 Tax=Dunaliella salina TaxID=3046 RepID=A0ABQ7GR10_DUNSA|nr:hypothetical protein DUNSADRAFT_4954 [Dunaliella salina]|eukprot:KAF5837029.1 hypothetical protein DUNSADRAFT_4954 [Dunaliella salina]